MTFAPAQPDPSSRPADVVKVRLLQGPIYNDGGKDFDVLLAAREELEKFFRHIGQKVVISEEDGFAYLEQMNDDELPDFPRLFRRQPITREQAVMGVLLRERFERWSIEHPDDARCIAPFEELRADAEHRMPHDPDGQRSLREFELLMEKLVDLKLVRKADISDEANPKFEILPLIKARFTPAYCQEIRDHLAALQKPETSEGVK